jgi:hypothetical protein
MPRHFRYTDEGAALAMWLAEVGEGIRALVAGRGEA